MIISVSVVLAEVVLHVNTATVQDSNASSADQWLLLIEDSLC